MKKNTINLFTIIALICIIVVLGILNFKLKKENKQLTMACDKISEFKFRPFVVPKNENINIGEEYAAAIFVTAINKSNLPIVTTIDSIGEQRVDPNSFTDTVEYDNDYNMYIYRFTPSSKGIYTWRGSMVLNYGGKTDTTYFESAYNVK